jgi:general secretion pathway protein J
MEYWNTGMMGRTRRASSPIFQHSNIPIFHPSTIPSFHHSIIPLFRSSGFTLLELIVAMSLMVVVASSLYTALYTGFRAYRSAQAAVDPTATAINVIELLKRDLYGVLPPGGTLAGAFIGTDTSGAKGVDLDSLEFYTTHISTEGEEVAGGVGKVNLLLEEDSETKDGTYLLLRQVTTNLLASREVEAQEQVLCRNVISLNLRYHDGSDWLDEWDSTADANSLPRAVEIDIEIARDDQRSRELQKRRLLQSFVIPCKTAPSDSETTTNGTSGGGGNTPQSPTTPTNPTPSTGPGR